LIERLVACLVEASADLPQETAGALHHRFLAWARAGTNAPSEEGGPPAQASTADESAEQTRILLLDPALRSALADRDISSLYRALQRAGVSQRVIAARTGQSQSEVNEILGGRRVQSVQLLERIVDGLGIARSAVGLAGREDSAEAVSVTAIVVKPAAAPVPPLPAAPAVIRTAAGQPAGTVDVSLWTARDVWALRRALRHTASEFAKYLRVSTGQVSKWEAGFIPNPFHQSLLDTALARLAPMLQARFVRLATEDIGPASDQPVRGVAESVAQESQVNRDEAISRFR
jgi:transcriptional regulator with XRE-family HTH domain